jgi:hypothetical protein
MAPPERDTPADAAALVLREAEALTERLPLRPSVATPPVTWLEFEAEVLRFLLPEPLLSEPPTTLLREPAPLAPMLRLPEREAAPVRELSFDPPTLSERLPPEREAPTEAAA